MAEEIVMKAPQFISFMAMVIMSVVIGSVVGEIAFQLVKVYLQRSH